MAVRIGILSGKGGVSKSTLSLNLARAIELDGNNVVVIDTDPQRTAKMWAESKPEGYGLPVRHESESDASTLEKRIKRLSVDADFAVIDGAAKIEGATGAAVRASHAVLVPVQPTPADTWGARSVVEIVKETGTTAAIVITRQIVGTNLAEEVAEGLRRYGLPVFENRMSQRVAFAESMFDGKTVLDLPDAEKAKSEIQGIATDLAQLLSEL